MAGEATRIARPYAEAVFAHADESANLELWSEMLTFLSSVAEDEVFAPIVSNPLLEQQALTELLLEIAGERINDEGSNLVRLLVQNRRLVVLPEIKTLFEELKANKERVITVHVTSAYVLKPVQKKLIADALKAKLGRDVTITSEKDADLIGGVLIRAGDMVIDGSIRGKLQQLANELGI
ncbi:MAG: F0F1 ATP synthase subunit delta [Candidatus Thiodiazotropha sp. (ex Lucinoma aequizonata)]|nr:F0F1 ATP synthase subunit delta [Candidatus Thiodiazotropha sp. (ex Lucinoma aequizonata)]MCU7888255.1 F0F1 ATP synthase subunit delta [Candidatus Thiodiazotropha sp. (ex Lucinoma aequizonata)]MCU7894533.1 F0F1 ATP synthase subunit delta [Candidatus Thiodiazotropha sp. (ex Lucinoma aequizonata)]MCU7898980.1 F0F1 ATP synthase subunit delta [Candidatus Thiodiazotropha sp. (ex Lucinoma aequizonata)]MCU7900693.1 F0F1 ATP synthase subunit delta [Candidatus Thiodiazotropha sp. (ex Lucinoma aequizo